MDKTQPRGGALNAWRDSRRGWALLHLAVLLTAIWLSYQLGQRSSARAKRRRASTRPPASSSSGSGSSGSGSSDSSSIVLQSLWCTPIARTHLRTHPRVHNVTRFNEQLAQLILADHQRFVSAHAAHERDGGVVNDLFFEYQSGGGPTFNRSDAATRARLATLSFRRSDAFGTLSGAAAGVADALLQRWPAAARRSARRHALQAWATVHARGSRHQLHVHARATLSIVYYVRAGARAGALRLLDARGPRPPFEGDVRVAANEGEMVAFPGWLAHEVEAGGGDGVRVSVVFNVQGGWEGTDDDGGSGALQPIGGWGRRSACEWRVDWGDAVGC